MKKILPCLLASLLLLAAVPALASPTGASPAEAALWQAQAPAPAGDRQKLTTLVGEENTAAIFSRRVIQSGPVVNNASTIFVLPSDSILYHLSPSEFIVRLRETVYTWGEQAALSPNDYILNQLDGGFQFLQYKGEWTVFAGDDAKKQRILSDSTPMPDQIPIYDESAYLDGQLSVGDVFEDALGFLMRQEPNDNIGAICNYYLCVFPPTPN